MRNNSLSTVLLPASHRVLYLHRVGEEQRSFYPNGISEELLEEVLLSMIKRGYRFTSLAEALQSRTGRSVTLSSDDGFACNYHRLYPLLQKHNIPLCLFLIGKCTNNHALAWNHKLQVAKNSTTPEAFESYVASLADEFSLPAASNPSSRVFQVVNHRKDELVDLLWERFCPQSQVEYLKQHKPFLTAEQLRELSDAGVEIALHSHSHADFGRLSFEEMQIEIRQNREALEALNLPVQPYFSLPYGRQCSPDKLAALAKTEGLELILGTRYSRRDNHPGSVLWQRQPLEQSPWRIKQELWLKPWLRLLR